MHKWLDNALLYAHFLHKILYLGISFSTSTKAAASPALPKSPNAQRVRWCMCQEVIGEYMWSSPHSARNVHGCERSYFCCRPSHAFQNLCEQQCSRQSKWVLEGIGLDTPTMDACFSAHPLSDEEIVHTSRAGQMERWPDLLPKQPPTWEVLITAMKNAKIDPMHSEELEESLVWCFESQRYIYSTSHVMWLQLRLDIQCGCMLHFFLLSLAYHSSVPFLSSCSICRRCSLV